MPHKAKKQKTASKSDEIDTNEHTIVRKSSVIQSIGKSHALIFSATSCSVQLTVAYQLRGSSAMQYTQRAIKILSIAIFLYVDMNTDIEAARAVDTCLSSKQAGRHMKNVNTVPVKP